MPSLLSGSSQNASSPSGYAAPGQLQFALGPTPTTSTGYTLVSTTGSILHYTSSLGNLNFNFGVITSNIANQNIQLIGTGSNSVIVSGGTANVSTTTGALIVQGGIGVQGSIWTGQDINVNGITFGQGYRGKNNIKISGVEELGGNPTNSFNSIAIGNSALTGLATAQRTIAVGTHALSSGTDLVNNIAIGDYSLPLIGYKKIAFVGTMTNATKTKPVQIVIPNHNQTTGTQIFITDVNGMIELDSNYYYVDVISSSTLALYSDLNLNFPVNGILYSTYISSGTVVRPLASANNIALGTGAAQAFMDGKENFFIGHNIATSFNTGSYNFFIGHDVANNMTNGNRNISIGGNQLQDGYDDQINIGNVFYYNGGGYLTLNADVGVGIGTDSSSVDTGAFNVFGGAGISGNLFVGDKLNVTGNGDVTLSPQGASVIIQPSLGGSVTLFPQQPAPGNMDNMYIGQTLSRDANFQIVKVKATNAATSDLTGALQVAGGVGIVGDLWVGGVIHGSVAGGGGGAGTGGAALTTEEIQINSTMSNTLYYLTMSSATYSYSTLEVTTNLVYDTTGGMLSLQQMTLVGTSPSVSTQTGALTVAGGVGVQGSIYSADGNADQGYLLYTPRTTLSVGIPPANPRFGDFWVDPSLGASFQYIKDGTSTIWLQFTSV
jgi:hypothetical protein